MSFYETILIRNKAHSEKNKIHFYSSPYRFFKEQIREHCKTSKSSPYIINESNIDSIKQIADSTDHPVILVNTPLNRINSLNGLLNRINGLAAPGTILLAFSDTAEAAKKSLLSRYAYPINYLVYIFHFMFHRVFPKLSGFTEFLYKRINKRPASVLHSSEILGRVAAHGFSISDYSFENNVLLIAALRSPVKDQGAKVSKGLIFSMPRIGRQGKMIRVYKLRTMHAYAEYLQEFMLEKHGLDDDGKFRNDFRVASWGRLLRKYWIDELPMLLNLIKGDIKLVGVRPISRKYFELYPDEVKELRLKTKPGFIPPSYAYSPGSLQEIIELEKKYLQEHQEKPFSTDVKYIGKILINLLVRKIRSK